MSAERDPVRIPTPLALADEQARQAVTELRRSAEGFARVPWRSGDQLLGPVPPGQLWVVGARQEQGKTTFALNLFNAFAGQGLPTIFLTTEMTAWEMRHMWAALDLGLEAAAVQERAWDRLPGNAASLIEDHVQAQASRLADVALFCDLPTLDARAVRRAFEDYVLGSGYKIVILDHIHRWRPRDASQKTAELTTVIQGFKSLAIEHRLSVFLLAQVGRPKEANPLLKVVPPVPEELMQTSALQQESSVILMLHRARRKDATAAMVKEVYAGQREVADLIEPDVMCVTCAKHRTRGGKASGRMFRLRVTPHGALEEDSPLPGGAPDDDLPF